MVGFLGAGISLVKGGIYFRRVLAEFLRHWTFWVVSGSIGFGGFYALICFAADHSPGWVVATTWQLTIIASLFVLMLFGRTFPTRIWVYSAVVFAGILLVNISRIETENAMTLLLGASPVLLAAFMYPLGNQLVWEAKHGRQRLPRVDAGLLENPFAKVFLLSLGSLPFWALLYPFTNAPPPAHGQFVTVALVALLSGVIATSLFLAARNSAEDASQLAAVDATQSSEVLFALAGEMFFLQASLPSLTQMTGMLVACAGLVAFVRLEDR
jgi:drug/metabolite transporter (DMT)-like permease